MKMLKKLPAQKNQRAFFFFETIKVMLLVILMLMPFSDAWAQAKGKAKQKPAVDMIRATIMVRTTIVALNHANLTGNYTVLRELASPRFQARNSAATLAQAFAPLRREGVDLSPIVVLRPVFTRVPFIQNGHLVLTGYFPSRPKAVVFTLGYEPVGRKWRLSFISVNTQLVKAPAKTAAKKAKPNKAKKKSAKKEKKNTNKTSKTKKRTRNTKKGKSDMKK